jgi:hypothetical protein
VASPICTSTQLDLWVKDITGACLNCALHKSCIDDTIGTGDTGQECEDFAGNTGTASNAALCEATLQCELGVTISGSGVGSTTSATTSPVNVGTSRTLSNAFCGTATASACQQASTNAGLSACAQTIENGLPGFFPPGSGILSNIANVSFPGGQAGAIMTCLLKTSGGQCTTCVN